MPYKLSWKNTILEGYRNIVSWENPMSSPIIEENHQKNVLNGNILDSGLAIDPDNPYIGNCWVIYKDQATAEMIFEENSKAVPDIYQSLEGIIASDIVWSDV